MLTRQCLVTVNRQIGNICHENNKNEDGTYTLLCDETIQGQYYTVGFVPYQVSKNDIIKVEDAPHEGWRKG